MDFFVCMRCDETGLARELGDGVYCPHCESGDVVFIDEAAYERALATGDYRDLSDESEEE